MKIVLSIDTTEPFSNLFNLTELLQMAIEEVEENSKWRGTSISDIAIGAETKYTSDDGEGNAADQAAQIEFSLSR